jgi:ATP-dependent HslUV protease ATP-binding subunit HslU
VSALTPREIVEALDRHIVGQTAAKRAVAIAIRNRWRRQQLPGTIRDEVLPKNILLIGTTGIGKTEIARRVAQLIDAPFIKVEASKYTEVGYHGRDVESMARDLVEVSVKQVRARELQSVARRAEEAAEERVLDLLVPPADSGEGGESDDPGRRGRTREAFRHKLRAGELDSRSVEIRVADRAMPGFDLFSPAGMEHFSLDLPGLFKKLGRDASKPRRLPVREALAALRDEEAEKLLDEEKVHREGLRVAEESGIIFIDEIDKIISSARSREPGVSREGVQRDLLPVVEGTSVPTRYGVVRTDHVLFIGAGAFQGSRPSDLIPELQGRFPIRVELASLERADFLRILREPENALPRQYGALLGVDGVALDFTPEGLERIADLAWELNRSHENIGARRLATIFEKLLEEPLFRAPDSLGAGGKRLRIDAAAVDAALGDAIRARDDRSFIL